MKKYYLAQSGRLPVEIEAKTLSEAKSIVSEVATEERKLAKRRFGSAFKHGSDGCYSITLGKDPRSSLWTCVALIVSN